MFNNSRPNYSSLWSLLVISVRKDSSVKVTLLKTYVRFMEYLDYAEKLICNTKLRAGASHMIDSSSMLFRNTIFNLINSIFTKIYSKKILNQRILTVFRIGGYAVSLICLRYTTIKTTHAVLIASPFTMLKLFGGVVQHTTLYALFS